MYRRQFLTASTAAAVLAGTRSLHAATEAGARPHLLLGARKRLAVVAPDNEIVWEMPWGSIHDIHLTSRGNILTRRGKAEVVEIDPRRREIVWSFDGQKRIDRRIEVHSAEPIDDGKIAIAQSGIPNIIEVDRDKNVVRTIPLTVNSPSTHSDTRLVRRTPDGGYVVAHENDGKVRRYAADGSVAWTYAVPMFGRPAASGHGPDAFGNRLFSALVDGDGNYWIGTGNGHSVLKVSPDKEILWQLNQDDLPGIRLAWVTIAEPHDGTLHIGNCHAGPGQPIALGVDMATKEVRWKLDGHDRFGNDVSNWTAVPPDLDWLP